jgi:hypothetical protein
MLNADMELAFNVVDELTQINQCGGGGGGPNRCTENTAVSQYARAFANSNTVWLAQFAVSYKLMTEVGYTNTDLVCVVDTAGAPVGGVTVAQCTNSSTAGDTDAATSLLTTTTIGIIAGAITVAVVITGIVVVLVVRSRRPTAAPSTNGVSPTPPMYVP